MKIYLFILTFFFAPIFTFSQNYRTAQEVLRAVTQKTGWDKWQTVRSLKISSETPSLQKTEIAAYKFPSHEYIYTSSFNNQVRVTEVRTPQKAWRVETNGQKRRLRGTSTEKRFPVHELNLLFSTGLRMVEKQLYGKQMYEISKSAGGGRFHRFYFDKQTLLLFAIDWNYFDSTEDYVFFEDYRQVQGFWMPFREKISARTIKNIKNVELNVDVEALFREPR